MRRAWHEGDVQQGWCISSGPDTMLIHIPPSLATPTSNLTDFISNVHRKNSVPAVSPQMGLPWGRSPRRTSVRLKLEALPPFTLTPRESPLARFSYRNATLHQGGQGGLQHLPTLPAATARWNDPNQPPYRRCHVGNGRFLTVLEPQRGAAVSPKRASTGPGPIPEQHGANTTRQRSKNPRESKDPATTFSHNGKNSHLLGLNQAVS